MLLTLLHKIKFGEVVFVLFGEVCSIIQRRVSVSHKETLKRKGLWKGEDGLYNYAGQDEHTANHTRGKRTIASANRRENERIVLGTNVSHREALRRRIRTRSTQRKE